MFVPNIFRDENFFTFIKKLFTFFLTLYILLGNTKTTRHNYCSCL